MNETNSRFPRINENVQLRNPYGKKPDKVMATRCEMDMTLSFFFPPIRCHLLCQLRSWLPITHCITVQIIYNRNVYISNQTGVGISKLDRN